MSAYSAEVLADGPVAYWPLTETSGDAIDLVAGVHATPTTPSGMRAVPYPGTEVMDFSGTNTYLTVAASDMGGIYWAGTDYSVEWWAVADSLNTDAVVSQRSASSGSDIGVSVFAGTAGAGVLVTDMGQSTTRAGLQYTVVPGEWHHYIYTFNKAGLIRKLYVDGVEVGYNAGANSVTPAEVPPMYIGILGGNTSYAWDGGLGHISLYRTELTAEQALTHYRASGSEGKKALIGTTWEKRPIKRRTQSGWTYSPSKRAI